MAARRGLRPDARQRPDLALPDRPPRDHRHAPAGRRAPRAGSARAARRAGPRRTLDRTRDAGVAGRRRARETHARASPGDPPRPRPGAVGTRDRRAARAPRGHRQEPYVVCAAFAAAGIGRNGSAGMTHVHEDIGAYVLGGLDAESEQRVAAHLAECGECAAAHAELAGLPGLLDLAVVTGASDEEPLPPAIEERLLDRFARERVERPERRRWRPRLALGLSSALVGAAVAVALLVIPL